jgi:hypothetical protein
LQLLAFPLGYPDVFGLKVRNLWQFAHTTSHFLISSSKADFLPSLTSLEI